MRKLNVLLIMCLVVIVASTVRAQSTPGVNNAELSGNYAFKRIYIQRDDHRGRRRLDCLRRRGKIHGGRGWESD
jgi:hypothetical protein